MKRIRDLSIKIKLTVPILIIILILSSASFFITNYYMNMNIHHEKEHSINYKINNTNIVIDTVSDKALAVASSISELDFVKDAYHQFYQTGSIEKSQSMLQENISAIADRITNETGIQAKIHFHIPPARSLIRCWNGTGGDELIDFRNTILKVSETHQPVMGIEMGRAGLVVRGLSPIFLRNGKFAGSVEFILPFSQIQDHLIPNKDEEIGFYNKVSAIKGIEVFSSKYKVNENQEQNTFNLFNKSSEAFHEHIIGNYLVENYVNKTIVFTQNGFQFVLQPINDFSGKNIGLIVYQDDISNFSKNSFKAKLILIIFTGLLALLSIATIILIIRNTVTKPIYKLKEVSTLHSKGDLSYEINIPRNDEIGILAKAFKDLQYKSKIVIEQTQQIASGNFDVEINERSEQDELSIALNAMTLKLKESFEKQNIFAEESRQLGVELQQVMNSTSPFIAIGLDHKILRVNRSFCEIYGKSENELIGSNCSEVINIDFCTSERCILQRILNGETNVKERIKMNIQNGSITNMQVTATALKDADGNVIGIVESFIDVTEMEQLQELTKANERKYHTMFQKSPAAIIMTDAKGKIVDLNNRVKDWLGFDRDSIIGKIVLKLPFIASESRERIIEEYKLRAAGKERSAYELEFLAKDGKKHIGTILVNTIKDNSQKIVGEIITILDITHEKEIQEKVKKSELKFRDLFEKSPLSVWVEDFSGVNEHINELKKKGVTNFEKYFDDNPMEVEICSKKVKILSINDTTTKIFKANSKEDLLKNLDEIFTENSLELFKEQLLTIAAGGTEFEGECINKTFENNEINVFLKWSVSADSDNAYENVLVNLIDITKQKEAEHNLSERMKEIKALLRLSEIAKKDNLTFKTLFQEVLNIIKESWQKPEFTAVRITVNGKHYTSENWKESIWKQQADINVNDNIIGNIEVVYLKDRSKEDGSPFLEEENILITNIAARVGEIIERNLAEERLIKLSRGIEASPVSIVITDNQGTIEYINPKFTEVTGYTQEEVIGQNPRVLKSDEQDDNFYKTLWNTIISGNLWSGEFCNKKKNGEIFWESASISPVKGKSGEITHFVAVKEDITKRKEDEKLIAETNKEIKKNNWLITGLKTLTDNMQGDLKTTKLSKIIITFLAKYLNAQMGALYLVDENNENLDLFGTYAYPKSKGISFKIGEGLVGETAIEKKINVIGNVPDGYISINSALGKSVPKHLIICPFIYDEKVVGVIELASLSRFTSHELEFIETAMNDIAIAINSAIGREQVNSLLDRVTSQASELLEQKEELKATNSELEDQAEELRVSSEKLKSQQEELQVINEELEEKTETLETKSNEINEKNKRIEKAKKEIEKKAEDLTLASKYKSEFLANMSHELRTPLNSLLILSKNLADNKKENLDTKQVESAEIIYNSGNDLLNLINEILDLSKVEAGKMTTNIETIYIEDIKASVNRNFIHQTKEKGLDLLFDITDELPETIDTDRQRVDQIIKNLISNALKFTQAGSITVSFHRPAEDTDLSFSGLDPQKTVGISITDTGIGIPKEKQAAIFEAFQQADGTTSRKFGGTGLGLSISKEFSKLLGGELQLKSEEGKGSTFTCFLPESSKGKSKPDEIPDRRKNRDRRLPPIKKIADVEKIITNKKTSIEDDRNTIIDNDKKLLVIEDDVNFAKTLKSVCDEKGFKFLHAADGETGLELAAQYIPDGIILDIGLPGISGWEVLDILKEDQKTRHIPVHVMSAMDKTIDAFQKGAVSFLTKPVNPDQLNNAFSMIGEFNDKKKKKLLIVEDNDILRNSVIQLIEEKNIEIDAAVNGKEVIGKVQKNRYDCMILDITLPDISGFELLNKMNKDSKIDKLPPIIIYTGSDINEEEAFELRKYAKSIIIKGVKSEERLIDETALFLHQVVSEMPESKQKIISKLHNSDSIFVDKKILIVDDDMRNVFAVSAALEEKNMNITSAANGQKALDVLQQDNNFDLILMDIMMPIMDGYETMGHIRKNKKVKEIPIIALTAKAMVGDKEKCIQAGANDYLTKPLNVDRLLSLMRVWLQK